MLLNSVGSASDAAEFMLPVLAEIYDGMTTKHSAATQLYMISLHNITDKKLVYDTKSVSIESAIRVWLRSRATHWRQCLNGVTKKSIA